MRTLSLLLAVTIFLMIACTGKDFLPGDVTIRFSSDTIHFDKQTSCWITLEHRNAQGIVVVPGNFDAGPYFRMENPQQAIPPDVIVVTRQLYPGIGQSIRSIKGIICEHGALSAHVAILAREYQVPLKIQASIDKYTG